MQFDGPQSVAQRKGSRNMFGVADTGNDRIQIFAYDFFYFGGRNLGYEWTLGSNNTVNVQFDGPRSVDVGGRSTDVNFIVADAGRVQHVSLPDGVEAELGSSGTVGGEFVSPSDADMTRRGAYAIADTGNHRIPVFHPNHTLRFVLGLAGGSDLVPNATGGPEPAPPAPTCSINIGGMSLDMVVSHGGVSAPVMQTVNNTGSLSFTGISIDATPWYIDPAGAPPYGADHPALPPSLTELSVEGPDPRTFAALSADGTAPAPLAAGLAPDAGIRLWFRINLDGSAGQGSGTLVQHVTYVAECAAPPPPT